MYVFYSHIFPLSLNLYSRPGGRGCRQLQRQPRWASNISNTQPAGAGSCSSPPVPWGWRIPRGSDEHWLSPFTHPKCPRGTTLGLGAWPGAPLMSAPHKSPSPSPWLLPAQASSWFRPRPGELWGCPGTFQVSPRPENEGRIRNAPAALGARIRADPGALLEQPMCASRINWFSRRLREAVSCRSVFSPRSRCRPHGQPPTLPKKKATALGGQRGCDPRAGQTGALPSREADPTPPLGALSTKPPK